MHLYTVLHKKICGKDYTQQKALSKPKEICNHLCSASCSLSQIPRSMDKDEPRRSMGARPKLSKLPNPSNEAKRAKKRADKEVQQPVRQPVQQQQMPISAIPPFGDSRLTLNWTLLEGLIRPVGIQWGESCVSVVLCRLLQAYHNSDKVVALHHKFSVKDLTDYVLKKTKRLSISNINIALDYIVNIGLLKEPEGRTVKATGKGFRVKARFEVKRVSRDDVYEILQKTTLAISLEDTPGLLNLGAEDIYDVPIHRFFKPKEGEIEVPDHALLVVAKGQTKTGKDFLVVQNSWGDAWCNHGYGRIWLNPAGKFDVFWPVEVLKQ